MSIRTVEQPALAVRIASQLTLAEVLRVCSDLQLSRHHNGTTTVNGLTCSTPDDATLSVINHYLNTVEALRVRARELRAEADRIDALLVGVLSDAQTGGAR